MSIFSGITSGAIEGIANGAEKLISRFVESPEEKNKLMSEMRKLENEEKKNASIAADNAEKNLNDRIKEQEGTAKDLLALPFVGRIVIFLRGMQRPVWGFATLYFDFIVFMGKSTVILMNPSTVDKTGVLHEAAWTPEGMLLVVINILVLGFLFGERTLKNLEPLLTKIFAK